MLCITDLVKPPLRRFVFKGVITFNLSWGTVYDLHLLLMCMQLDVIRDMAFFFLTSYYPVHPLKILQKGVATDN